MDEKRIPCENKNIQNYSGAECPPNYLTGPSQPPFNYYPEPPPPYYSNTPSYPPQDVQKDYAENKTGQTAGDNDNSKQLLPPPVLPQIVQIVQAPPPTVTLLGPESMRMSCPHCQADISTKVDKDPSVCAYASAACLFLFGCSLGCCLIPFCIDSCKTSEHYCPNCKRFIGRYTPN